MAYDREPAERIRRVLADTGAGSETKMFGGVGRILIDGNEVADDETLAQRVARRRASAESWPHKA